MVRLYLNTISSKVQKVWPALGDASEYGITTSGSSPVFYSSIQREDNSLEKECFQIGTD